LLEFAGDTKNVSAALKAEGQGQSQSSRAMAEVLASSRGRHD